MHLNAGELPGALLPWGFRFCQGSGSGWHSCRSGGFPPDPGASRRWATLWFKGQTACSWFSLLDSVPRKGRSRTHRWQAQRRLRAFSCLLQPPFHLPGPWRAPGWSKQVRKWVTDCYLRRPPSKDRIKLFFLVPFFKRRAPFHSLLLLFSPLFFLIFLHKEKLKCSVGNPLAPILKCLGFSTVIQILSFSWSSSLTISCLQGGGVAPWRGWWRQRVCCPSASFFLAGITRDSTI